jgi:hypothetical protein
MQFEHPRTRGLSLVFLGIDFGTRGAQLSSRQIVAEDKRDFGTLEDYERAGIWREAL